MISRNIFSVRVNFHNFHTVHNTVWKNKKFSLTKKIFRQINSLVTYLVKLLLSRIFCQKCVRENSHNFHTVHFFCYSDFTWNQSWKDLESVKLQNLPKSNSKIAKITIFATFGLHKNQRGKKSFVFIFCHWIYSPLTVG